MSSLGWKDVLRPIRDGYRHLFPSPDTGPTPEERERQRALDQLLKGFTYFDTFDQLQSWTTADGDIIQRANTPLLRRSRVIKEEQKANVLLCHDYSGNYHDYETAQGVGVHEESYTCEHLQFIDTFVYFSHKLACVPPSSWTNTLHRNGVKVLGTFLVEPQTKHLERLLESDTNGFPLARKLADIAECYGFDGWLVNIEKPFTRESWDQHNMEAFLQQLKRDLGVNKKVIWYDALTTDNKIDYQNALTHRNLPFSKACGNVLTNYCWDEFKALSSERLASANLLASDSLVFGVDVWAQNTTKLTHPRVTYGGGGTNTGMAVAKLAKLGLAVGIFAPAWCFEHFPGHGRTVQRAMWDGTALPASLHCSCGNTHRQHPSNREYFITQFARQFPAGSERFFFTDFQRAFGHHTLKDGDILYDGRRAHSQLTSQSILPHTSKALVQQGQVDTAINVFSHRLVSVSGQGQLHIDVQSLTSPTDATEEKTYERFLPFYKLDMPADGSLHFRMEVRCTLHKENSFTACYLKFSNAIKFLTLELTNDVQIIEASVALYSKDQVPGRLLEIGLRLQAPPFGLQSTRVAEILEICIAPTSAPFDAHTIQSDHVGGDFAGQGIEIKAEDTKTESTQHSPNVSASPASLKLSSNPTYQIHDVRTEQRGEGPTSHQRLCWTYAIPESPSPETIRGSGMPYSDTTGPFSYFLIWINGIELGRAYALEHVLPDNLMNFLTENANQGVDIHIVGVGFDGRNLAEQKEIWHP